jgi:hypothetical protein
MKTKLSIIAALFALILTGCAKENRDPKMVTVTVSMTSPEDDAATRVSLTPDSGTPQGLILKWETTDKLMLCFEYNANYYHVDANIDPGSISANGKTADFNFTIPTQIPSGANFNLYVVYQKTNGNSTDGGYFRPNTKIYDLEKNESTYITLNQPTNNSNPRPMLYFQKTNIANTATPDIGPINLIHAGWIMAIHFKNNSSTDIDLPKYIGLAPFSFSGDYWVYNGNDIDNFTTSFDFSSHTFSSSNSDLSELDLYINKDGSPLYGHKLAPNTATVFYRWVASDTSIPQLFGGIEFPDETFDVTYPGLSAKTITYGKVYHIYTVWPDFAFSAPY